MTAAKPAFGRSCLRCGLCRATCPEGAIETAAGYPRVTGRCTGCGDCFEVCPVGAAILEATHGN